MNKPAMNKPEMNKPAIYKHITNLLTAASYASADVLAAASAALRSAPFAFETDIEDIQTETRTKPPIIIKEPSTEANEPSTEAKEPSSSDAVIISLEGNIGSGKSTLLEKLKEQYADDKTICFLDEPVNIWNTIKDASGTTILENYYADQQKWAFAFQMMAYISRVSIMRAALKQKKYRIIIIERSVYTDSAVFAKMLYDDKKIGEIEYMIYMNWVKEFIEDFPTTKFIYVRADPTTSYQRVLERNRPGEDIPLIYLQNCHKYHEDWLLHDNKISLMMLDANMDVKKDANLMAYWLRVIDRFIKS